MNSRIKLSGFIIITLILCFSITGCKDKITHETKQITITILNENDNDIEYVSVWTLADNGSDVEFLIGSAIKDGQSVSSIHKNETYTSPLITIRDDGYGYWLLGINVNNNDGPYPLLLDGQIPPDTAAFKYTEDEKIERVD